MGSKREIVEMDPRDLFLAAIKGWWMIGLIVVVFGLSGYGFSKLFLDPEYEASTILLLVDDSEEYVFNALVVEANNKLLNEYAEILTSRMVMREVTEEMGLEMSEGNFRSRILIDIKTDSRFFSVGFNAGNPELAASAANKLAAKLIEKADTLLSSRNIIVIDPASPPPYAVRPSNPGNAIMGAVAGLVVALLVVFLKVYTAHTMRHPADVERLLEIPVLASIPPFHASRVRKGGVRL